MSAVLKTKNYVWVDQYECGVYIKTATCTFVIGEFESDDRIYPIEEPKQTTSIKTSDLVYEGKVAYTPNALLLKEKDLDVYILTNPIVLPNGQKLDIRDTKTHGEDLCPGDLFIDIDGDIYAFVGYGGKIRAFENAKICAVYRNVKTQRLRIRTEKFDGCKIQIQHPNWLKTQQERNSTYTDVTLVCDDGNVQANKYFLCTHSSFFKAMFEGKFKESQTSVVKLDGTTKGNMEIIAQYCAMGKAAYPDTINDLIGLYDVADKFFVIDLKPIVLNTIYKMTLNCTNEECWNLAKFALSSDCKKLYEKCMKYMKSKKFEDVRAELEDGRE